MPGDTTQSMPIKPPTFKGDILNLHEQWVIIDVLEVLGGCFKPTQSVLQSWYQLGSVYSSQCKDQMVFLNKMKNVGTDCSFSNKDEVIKFLFITHNTNERVKDYLIEHM